MSSSGVNRLKIAEVVKSGVRGSALKKAIDVVNKMPKKKPLTRATKRSVK